MCGFFFFLVFVFFFGGGFKLYDELRVPFFFLDIYRMFGFI